jgi:tight adherence protein B
MNFVVMLLLVWAIVVGGWFFLTRSMKSSDAQKLTDRVLGTQKAKKKGAKGRGASAQLLTEDDRITGKYVLRLLSRYRLEARLKSLIEQAGLRWKLARLVQMSLGLFLFGFACGYLMLPAAYQAMSVVPGLLTAVLPWLYVGRVRAKRLFQFEEQFPESLEFVARSMRAGHAFSISLEMLHREFQEPLAGEFRRTFEEHNLGLPLDAALQKLALRVPSLDVHFFVSAVLLQKRTGGNLAEILDKLAYVIRERFKLRGKIRAISAHGRMTGMALTSIPLMVAGLMFLVNPDYVRFFFVDEVGQIMAVAGALLQVLGYLIIKKIVNIEV